MTKPNIRIKTATKLSKIKRKTFRSVFFITINVMAKIVDNLKSSLFCNKFFPFEGENERILWIKWSAKDGKRNSHSLKDKEKEKWKKEYQQQNTEHTNYYAMQTELDENRVEPLCVHVSFSLFGRAEHFSKFATSHNFSVSFTLWRLCCRCLAVVSFHCSIPGVWSLRALLSFV